MIKFFNKNVNDVEGDVKLGGGNKTIVKYPQVRP